MLPPAPVRHTAYMCEPGLSHARGVVELEDFGEAESCQVEAGQRLAGRQALPHGDVGRALPGCPHPAQQKRCLSMAAWRHDILQAIWHLWKWCAHSTKRLKTQVSLRHFEYVDRRDIPHLDLMNLSSWPQLTGKMRFST